VAMADCGVFRQGQKIKNTFYYFYSVQISEQIVYNLTRGKAVFPRSLRQGGANFEPHFQFFSTQK
jgi:hypothetical protein